jgi:hypothetical protein
VSQSDPITDGHRQVYSSRTRQWLLAGGLLAVYLATVSFCWQVDPDTGMKPLPSDYLPIVIPGSIAILYLVWRAMKARIETTDRGIDLIRVVGHEYFPWSAIRDFEVLPSPSRRGYTVRLRQHNETLVIVRNEINLRPLRDLPERQRLAHVRALAFREVLEADRLSRLSPAGSPDATVS